jgi:hypothetical protein
MRSKYEIKCHKELQADGWLVDYKIRGGGPYVPRNYTVDYFACFDILAYKPNRIRFIAIKGHQGVPKDLRDAIVNLRFPEGCQKEIWTYKENKEIRKEIIP